jgi:hypothetical protein
MYIRRTEPLTLRSFVYKIEEGLQFAATVLAVVAVVGGIVLGLTNLFTWETAAGNKSVLMAVNSYGEDAKDTSAAAASQRSDRAQQLVDTYDIVEEFDDDVAFMSFSEDQWEQVRKVAKTGQPAKLDTEYVHFSMIFGWPIGPVILAIALSLAGTAALFSYADEVSDWRGGRRLADLPWKSKPWPWIATLVLGPAWWVVMPVSAVLLRGTRPVEQANPDRNAQQFRPDPFEVAAAEVRAVFGDHAPEPPRAKKKNVKRTYPTSPNASRSRYVDIRTTAALGYRNRKLTELDGELEYAQLRATNHGNMLRETQQRINTLRAERQQTAAALEAEGQSVDATVASQEFDRICQLPGVLATQVVNERLRVIVRAQYRYDKVMYDLGDWQIDIGADTSHIEARELRSGMRSDWYGGYPAYRLGGGLFCFGNREEIINEHVRKGQYLEAISIAISSLNGVNKDNRHRVPDAFYPVES